MQNEKKKVVKMEEEEEEARRRRKTRGKNMNRLGKYVAAGEETK